MKQLLSVLIILTFCFSAISQSAESIIDASIAYHDPKGILDKQEWTMSFEESRPNGSVNETYFQFEPKTYDFEVARGGEGKRVVLKMMNGELTASLNGSNDYSEEDAKKYRSYIQKSRL